MTTSTQCLATVANEKRNCSYACGVLIRDAEVAPVSEIETAVGISCCVNAELTTASESPGSEESTEGKELCIGEIVVAESSGDGSPLDCRSPEAAAAASCDPCVRDDDWCSPGNVVVFVLGVAPAEADATTEVDALLLLLLLFGAEEDEEVEEEDVVAEFVVPLVELGGTRPRATFARCASPRAFSTINVMSSSISLAK